MIGAALWLSLCLFHLGDDHWKSKWAFVAVILGAFVAVRSCKQWGITAGLFLGWSILSACTILFRLHPEIEQFPSRTITSLQSLAGASAVILFLLIVAAESYRESWDIWIERAFAASSALGAAFTGFQYVVLGARGQGLGGFVDQSSMHGCLVVIGLPYIIKHFRGWWLGGALAMIALMVGTLLVQAESSTPLGAAAVCGVAWLASSRWKRWGVFDVVVSTAPVLVAVFVTGSWLNPLLFNDSYRFQFWQFFMSWWWRYANIWLGTGFSTFFLYGPMIQLSAKYNSEEGLYVWTHGDWLQLLFEIGIIGFVLAVVVFCEAVWRSYKTERYELLTAIVTFAAVMAVQYPWRLAPFALMGSLLLVMALKRPLRKVP